MIHTRIPQILVAGALALLLGAQVLPVPVAPAPVDARPATGAVVIPSCGRPAPGDASCTLELPRSATAETATPATLSMSQISGLKPADIASAYGLTGGVSGTVAVVDAYDNPNLEADLAVYRDTMGLPACTTANGCFRKVSQRGNTTDLPAPDASWGMETALDVDAVSAACPACSILVVETDSASMMSLGSGVNMAVAMGATAVSNSWGGTENGNASYYSATYFTHPGVPIVASSGDSGYPEANVPATLPNVIAVGGTTLTAVATPATATDSSGAAAASSGSSVAPALATASTKSTAATKRASTKTAAKQATAKKSTAKKSTANKSTAKKSTAKKTAAVKKTALDRAAAAVRITTAALKKATATVHRLAANHHRTAAQNRALTKARASVKTLTKQLKHDRAVAKAAAAAASKKKAATKAPTTVVKVPVTVTDPSPVASAPVATPTPVPTPVSTPTQTPTPAPPVSPTPAASPAPVAAVRTGWTETVWNGAGSGCSTRVAKPTWQTSQICSTRSVADIAAVADPATGLAVYDTYGTSSQTSTGWFQAGGTSLAAPLVAAMIVRSGHAANYNNASPLYANASGFWDVTSGSNGSCSGTAICTGATGYDGPTGLGTPKSLASF